MDRAVVFAVFLSAWTIGVALSNPENCTVKENLPCMRYTVTDCSPDKLSEEFGTIYNDSVDNPGRAFHFNKTIFYKLYEPHNKTYPGVELTFTPPADGSIRFVKGFQISRTKSNAIGDVTCYIYNMSDANWSAAEDKNTVFSLNIFPIRPGIQYYYQLYTLPRPFAEYDQYRDVGVLAQDPENPADWMANIGYDVYHEYGHIDVEFNIPPAKFAFKDFRVELYDIEKNQMWKSKIIKGRYSCKFREVPPGVYQVWIQPVDPFDGDYINCVCKAAEGGCGSCTTTYSKNITMRAAPVTTTSTSTPTPKVTTPTTPKVTTPNTTPTAQVMQPEDSDVSTTKIIAAILGTIGGLILVGLVIVCYCFHNRGGHALKDLRDVNQNENDGYDDLSTVVTIDILNKEGVMVANTNNGVVNKIQFPTKKKLFLLYEEDHRFHRLVVDKFASYLSQHCQCDVALVELQQDAAWVHQDLAQADNVIIVNSQAAYKACLSNGSPKSTGKDYTSSSINSIRNKFLKEGCYDHTIMVYFSYTDEKYILPDICTGYKYRLMKHFTDFLLHVHKLRRTDNLSGYDLPFDGNHNLRPIGLQLLEAIEGAARYELENPNWYIQSRGMSRGMSNTSEESRLASGDSGCPDDFSPGVTPSTNLIDPWAKIKYPENVLKKMDTKSVITVSQSDLNFYDNQYLKEIPKITTPKERKSLMLSPVSFQQNIGANPELFSPPTESPIDEEFEFSPPDTNSNFDAMSNTQSTQLKKIVNQYTHTVKDLGVWKGSKCPKEMHKGQGQYDKEADLAILDACSREVMFNSAMEGDTISLGSVGAISM